MAGTTRHETNHRPERLTMSTRTPNTTIVDAIMDEYKTLRSDAGYGSFTGSGTRQNAQHVAWQLSTYANDDMLTTDMAVGIIAGFLAGSLANTFDIHDVAVGFVDEFGAAIGVTE